MIKHVIKEMINRNIKTKMENIVIHEIWDVEMMSFYVEFLESDYVLPQSYLYCGLEGFWDTVLLYETMSLESDTISTQW